MDIVIFYLNYEGNTYMFTKFNFLNFKSFYFLILIFLHHIVTSTVIQAFYISEKYWFPG